MLINDRYTQREIPNGTKLRCLNAVGVPLTVGVIYTVVGRSCGYVNVVNSTGSEHRGLFWHRFERVNTNQGDD